MAGVVLGCQPALLQFQRIGGYATVVADPVLVWQMVLDFVKRANSETEEVLCLRFDCLVRVEEEVQSAELLLFEC